MTRGLSPAGVHQTYLRKKEERRKKFAEKPEAFIHNHSQQPFSAALLFQQLFSAAILSYHLAVVRGRWSAIESSAIIILLLWSGVNGQLLSSRCCGQGLSSCCCGQGLVGSYCHHAAVACCCGQGLVVSNCHHVAVACCCGQGLVVGYCHHVAVVKGWWSAISIMLLWSGGPLVIIMLLWPVLGGQLRTGCINCAQVV